MAAAATIPMLHKSSHVVDGSSSSIELFELGNLVLVDFSSFGGSRVFLGSTSDSVSLHSLAANKHSNSPWKIPIKKLFTVVT